MSYASGEVRFYNGKIKYFKYNGTSDVCLPKLYDTYNEMLDNWRTGIKEKGQCEHCEEIVEIYTSYAGGFSWNGTVCKKCMMIIKGKYPFEEDVILKNGVPEWAEKSFEEFQKEGKVDSFKKENEVISSVIIGIPGNGKEIRLIDKIKMSYDTETLDTVKTTLTLLNMFLDENNIDEVIKVILNEDVYSGLYRKNLVEENYDMKNDLLKRIVEFSSADEEGELFRKKIVMTILEMCLNENNVNKVMKIVTKG